MNIIWFRLVYALAMTVLALASEFLSTPARFPSRVYIAVLGQAIRGYDLCKSSTDHREILQESSVAHDQTHRIWLHQKNTYHAKKALMPKAKSRLASGAVLPELLDSPCWLSSAAIALNPLDSSFPS